MPAVTNAQDWAVLPYNSKKINDHYLVSNFLGNWDFLVQDEFRRLQQLSLEANDNLFDRLYEKGIVVQKESMAELIAGYRNLNATLFSDTTLHIAVVTTRCNLACHYCQAASNKSQDMDIEVATRVIKYLFDVRSPNITLELQGGEPLLNWDVVKFLVGNTRELNTTGKNINICMVTNGILLSEEKIDFLLDHDVSICISLDGPKRLHDSHRVFDKGTGSYKFAVAAIQRLRDAYKKRKINRPIDLLPTFTKHNIPFVKEVIDEHIKWGSKQVAIRAINKLGAAEKQWGKIGCSVEEFNCGWAEGMDYMLELNAKGINIKERMATVALRKILKKEDPGYVDLMSPCGAGRLVLAYNPNGDIYPCDEARMGGCKIFKLGNILQDDYDKIMKSPGLFSVCQSSVMDLWSYNDVYAPWLGTCPVMNYESQGNLVPKITQTPLHKIQHFQFDYLFKKMIESEQAKETFKQWVR
ncbi:MAG: His-Xaa-Ser system radical SAM maturase HxsB [Candidatus Omnitrophica bacterium]|nr:His-Xaa-Ser system radical SAM maturase HxsB [Candidatus Omnitrophota bacterium]